MGDKTGINNNNWKGGRVTDPRGYVLIRLPLHPRADVRGYVYEHVLIAERRVGRYLLPGEEVHHKDERPGNNADDNLVLCASHAAHRFLHRKRDSGLRFPGQLNVLIDCECRCGECFMRYDLAGRPRRYVTGHNRRKAG